MAVDWEKFIPTHIFISFNNRANTEVILLKSCDDSTTYHLKQVVSQKDQNFRREIAYKNDIIQVIS